MKISVLIPCHNEELTIQRCIESVLQQSVQPDEIIVVDDGSTDNSLSILTSFKHAIKIVKIEKPSGNKSYAQEVGLRHVTGNILVTTDADTTLDKDFIFHMIKEFRNKDVIASSGYVKSIKHNWLTACRQIDYLISQEIHKAAQANINALFVIPGCAAAYRTKDFKKYIGFDHDTLTEDLDFTYKHHKNNLKITFSKKAIVYTQDPSKIKDYVKQLRRWNAGNWQNFLKHYQIISKPGNALEISIMYLEGLVFPFMLLLALMLNLKIFFLLALTYLIIISAFAVYGAYRDKRVDLLLHLPTYFLVSFINYTIFIEQFVYEILLRKKNLVWIQPERRGAFA